MSVAIDAIGHDQSSSEGRTITEPAGEPTPRATEEGALLDHLLRALRLLKGKYQLRLLPGHTPELTIELDPPSYEKLQTALEAERPAASGGAEEHSPVPTSRIRILVADDSPIERRCLHNILSRDSRIEPVEVSDGLAAWEQLDGGLDPALCIFDIMMPRMNGLDVVERMRKDARFTSTPVILCTALKDRETLLRAAPLRVSYYMVKPYSSTDVLAQIHKVVGKSSAV